MQEAFNGKFYLDYHIFVVKEISYFGKIIYIKYN